MCLYNYTTFLTSQHSKQQIFFFLDKTWNCVYPLNLDIVIFVICVSFSMAIFHSIEKVQIFLVRILIYWMQTNGLNCFQQYKIYSIVLVYAYHQHIHSLDIRRYIHLNKYHLNNGKVLFLCSDHTIVSNWLRTFLHHILVKQKTI